MKKLLENGNEDLSVMLPGVSKIHGPCSGSYGLPLDGKLPEKMRIVYCDESGMGSEPIATMVGIVVNSRQQHLVQHKWEESMKAIRHLTAYAAGTKLEFHAADFYAGNGPYRPISSNERTKFLDFVFGWLKICRLQVVYSAVNKEMFRLKARSDEIPSVFGTHWRFMGLHLVLAMQEYAQRLRKGTNSVLFVFDNRYQEHVRFADLIVNPPDWSRLYYYRGPSRHLDTLVDVPYFGDSKDVALIQVADAAAYFLRRYAELKEGLTKEKYTGELGRITGWVGQLVKQSIGREFIYRRVRKSYAHEVFYDSAPKSIRDL